MKVFGAKSPSKHRTSLRLPESILEKLKKSMDANKYSTRNRSLWICEALQGLVLLDNYTELVAEVFMDKGANEVIPLTLDGKTYSLLKLAAENYTQVFNTEMVDQSVVLRAAITQRLITEEGGLVKR